MTLPDLEEREEEISNNNAHQQAGVTGAVVAVVKQAVEEGRVVCDLLTCVQLLGSLSGCEEVMLCILAQPTPASQTQSQDEIVVGIQHTLIRAFCQECLIDVLHVQDAVKLTQLLLTSLSQAELGPWQYVTKTPMAENSSGYSCILIKYPKNGNSHDDDLVAEYIKHEKAMNVMKPFVALPSFQ